MITTNAEKNMAPKNSNTRKTTTYMKENEKKENDNRVNKLVDEISSLKKDIDLKERIINDLTSERDRAKNDRDALNMKCELTQQQLADSTKKVEDLEAERTKLKREIDNLNNDVINSFIHEREEIHEWRKREKKESAKKIEELEKERDCLTSELHAARGDERMARNTIDTLRRKYDNTLKQHVEALEKIEYLENERVGTKKGHGGNHP